MTTYCTDSDLQNIRPNILDLGVADWAFQRERAFDYINRVITSRWYQSAATSMGYDPAITAFDPTRVQSGDLRDLECYKTLEMAYIYLMQDNPEEDAFNRNAKLFAEKFGQELEAILGNGLTYDWSGDGDFDYEEKRITSPRRLYRS